MHERRAHIRYSLERAIEYEHASGNGRMLYKGIAMDVCDAGLGIYIFSGLQPGQEIIIRNGLEDTYQNGTVVWCKELGEHVYRAGLIFNAWIGQPG